MAQEFILRENVLTDNVLIVSGKRKIFKGGYVAIIKEYSFETSWSDKETVKRFRNVDSLTDYLNRHYPEVEIDFTGTCLE